MDLGEEEEEEIVVRRIEKQQQQKRMSISLELQKLQVTQLIVTYYFINGADCFHSFRKQSWGLLRHSFNGDLSTALGERE